MGVQDMNNVPALDIDFKSGGVLPAAASDNVVIQPDSITAVLQKENEELKKKLSDVAIFQSDLALQPYIPGPPVPTIKHLYHRACSGDGVTIDTWIDTWLSHLRHTVKNYDLEKQSAIIEYGKCALKPCIIAGSGPSLKKNVDVLREQRGNITLVSCLHNFAFLEDNGVSADYYVNLDSGDITLAEMAQGGTKSEGHYWDLAKDRTLVSSVTGHPEMHKRWNGKKLFYSVIASAQEYVVEYNKITPFKLFFSVGGNALGACLYLAKGILGANPICFIGADFAFGYNKKFHSWDSPYDKQYSGLQYATDIFGNRVGTWPSYFNFKCWFDYVACGGAGNQPGQYINCTEGGILGAYSEGNIMQIQQMKLSEFLFPYNLHKKLPDIMSNKGYTFLF